MALVGDGDGREGGEDGGLEEHFEGVLDVVGVWERVLVGFGVWCGRLGEVNGIMYKQERPWTKKRAAGLAFIPAATGRAGNPQ